MSGFEADLIPNVNMSDVFPYFQEYFKIISPFLCVLQSSVDYVFIFLAPSDSMEAVT